MHSRDTDRVIVEQQSRLVDVSGIKCDSKELLNLDKKHERKESNRESIGSVLKNDSPWKRMEREKIF